MKKSIEFRKLLVSLSAILVALFLLLFPAIRANAEPVRIGLVPSLRLQEELMSNALRTTNNEISSFATRINPSLGLIMTSADNVSVQISGSYEKVWHHDRDARKADYDTWNIRVNSTGEWAFTPNFTVRPSVYFINTEESGRRAAFVPVHDPILSPISAIMYSNVKRQSSGTALNFVYRISPVLDTNLRVNHSNEHFRQKSDTSAGGFSPTDSSQTDVRVGFSYAFSPLARAGLFAQASFVNFRDFPDAQIYSMGATCSYQFTQFLQLFLDAGASHVVRDSESGSSSNKTGPMGMIRLQYDDNTFKATLFGTTTYSGGSGYWGITQEHRVGALISQQFSTTVSGSLSGYYQLSKSAQGSAVDIDTTNASATLAYRPWEIVSVYIRGIAENQKSHGVFGSTIENYTVVLGISLSTVHNIY